VLAEYGGSTLALRKLRLAVVSSVSSKYDELML